MSIQTNNIASKACQVMTNIRCRKELNYEEISKILKKEISFDDSKHIQYFLGFFENCRPALIKKFMMEQGISRQQIMDVSERLAKFGEIYKFKQAVANGEF